MADSGLRDALSRLFSSNVVVRNVGGDEIKIVDTSNIQDISRDYSNGGGFGGAGGGSAGYNARGGSQTQGFGGGIGGGSPYPDDYPRFHRYHDYELMDQDPIVSSALDFYADESVRKDEHGDVVTIKSPHASVERILKNLYNDILNIEHNLRSWVREMVKYGDTYLKVDIDYSNKQSYGVINVQPLSPYHVTRVEGNDPSDPYEVTFQYDGPGGEEEFGYWELAHFSLRDTQYAPYGRSVLEGGRQTWRRLTMMEDAMLIHRLMRAPERRVFKIDVGNIEPKAVEPYINRTIEELKSQPLVDPDTGEYDLDFNLMNMMDDYYMPVRGRDDATEINTLGGLNWDGINDIEYLRQKLMSGLRVPNAFLGYERDIEGKATLAQESIKFANMVEQIQKVMTSELTKIGIIHLFSQGIRDERLVDFKLGLTHPSHFVEEQRINILEQKYKLARDIEDRNLHSTDWIMKNVFNMTEEEIERERRLKVDDWKREFRKDQLTREGNDPIKTGQSFGTPGDLAMSGKSEVEGFDLEGEENEDVPKEEDPEYNPLDPGSSHEMPSSDDMRTTPGDVDHEYQGTGPLSAEGMEKHRRLISETYEREREEFNRESLTEEEVDDMLEDIDWMQEEEVLGHENPLDDI